MKSNMKSIIALAAISISPLVPSCEGDEYEPLPSREWVRAYVSNAISNSTADLSAKASTTTTNGVSSQTFNVNGIKFLLTWEPKTESALEAYDASEFASSFGVTNGTMWAYDSASSNFISAATIPIVVTPSNMVFATFMTSEEEPETFFDGSNVAFRVNAIKVSKRMSEEIKGE